MRSARTQDCASAVRPALFIAAGLALVSCGTDKGAPSEVPTDTSPMTETGVDTAEGWPATIGVRVTDEDGAPVEGAVVMMGGWSQADWVTTDAAGEVSAPVVDAGTREQYLLAGKEGWFSGGTALDFDSPAPAAIEITMRLLPGEDNPDHAFLAGGDGSSPDTSECGHCHWTIGDDWAGSGHAQAASSPAVWDIYTGSASGTADEAACVAQGGWWSDGQSPGEAGVVAPRCYLGAGVLPWLHDDCGGAAQPACDHPDQRASLAHFGSCGDCHSPAFDGGVPGSIDLAAATGVAFEGVTCDFCHKVKSVNPDTSPGLDGGIELLRSSAPTTLPNLVHEPITFGPYPDVIVPIMNGSYTPQFREAQWCASCHEYAQPALHPDETGLVDADRWPEGVPIFETYSEFSGLALSDSLSCQYCHMPTLDEESSTYDITLQGLEPSLDQGWMRETGEVRHHGFSSDGLGVPSLGITLVEVDGEIEATVTVTNAAAGHAVPTGEPMKQLMVRVSALGGGGDAVEASGGQVIPDVGGMVLSGEIDAGVTLAGTELTFDGAALAEADGLRVRFARPTGVWDDYGGPGTAGFSSDGLTAEDKGIALSAFLGDVAVSGVDGSTVTLAGPAPATEAGDWVYLVGTDDDAGAPGWLYAKVLVDASGARGVAHYRAVSVASDNRIAGGATGTSVHRFPAPAAGESLTVEASLVRRVRAASVADVYGWDRGDEALTTASETTSP